MPPIRFGSCLLDLDARQLLRHGQPVHLSPKAFELLSILVTERPKAISKTEFHERIWPGTFVTDDSLARLVAETRAAIGDHARTPTYIRTVHAFGYAFATTADDNQRPTPLEASCWLVINGRPLMLVQSDNVIGRDPDVQVALDSVRVSRRHALIRVGSTGASLEDLGSRNGTSVQGQRISGSVELADGDEITIGGFVLIFHSAAVALPTEADDA